MNNDLITLKDVHKKFQLGETTVHALNGISLSIKKGEFTSLVGPSGSGKTTILNLIGCIDFPSQGEVLINNKNSNSFNDKEASLFRNKSIGYIFQNFNLIPVLNVYENIEYPILIGGKKINKKRRAKINDLIEQVGLTSHIKHRPDKLSGGQRQRVAIARALVANPDLVIADEPTANLDHITGEEVLDIMKKFNKDLKTTFIFSTHSDMIMKYAKRIVQILDGKIISDSKAKVLAKV